MKVSQPSGWGWGGQAAQPDSSEKEHGRGPARVLVSKEEKVELYGAAETQTPGAGDCFREDLHPKARTGCRRGRNEETQSQHRDGGLGEEGRAEERDRHRPWFLLQSMEKSGVET